MSEGKKREVNNINEEEMLAALGKTRSRKFSPLDWIGDEFVKRQFTMEMDYKYLYNIRKISLVG